MHNFKRKLGFLSLAAASVFLMCGWLGQVNRTGMHRDTFVLWVRPVHGHPMFWVNNGLPATEPLTPLEKAIGSTPPDHIELQVILDSRVPIEKLFDIDWTIPKIPITNVRYYFFKSDSPESMYEITWQPKAFPLPGRPPNTK